MALFLNKKEQVYDLELTSYGRYLLSIGTFKPVYYTFLDDNILYDGAYAGITESQNSIEERIRNSAHFESPTLFADVEKYQQEFQGAPFNVYESIFSQERSIPRRDIFKINSIIGDMRLESDGPKTPAWKIVSLQGQITSSQYSDFKEDSDIPQVNIDLNYNMRILPAEFPYDPENVIDIIGQTDTFSDNSMIKIEPDDAMIYIDEVNTEILTENYDIEIFYISEYSPDYGYAEGQITFPGKEPYTGAGLKDTIRIGDGTTHAVFEFTNGTAIGDNIKVEVPSPYDVTIQQQNFITAFLELTTLNIVVSSEDRTSKVLFLKANRKGPEFNVNIELASPNWTGLEDNEWIVKGMLGGDEPRTALHRKYFQKTLSQVEGGFMMRAQPDPLPPDLIPGDNANPPRTGGSYTTSSVEYYFDILRDQEVNQAMACQSAEMFNKESYYVDFDFDCSETTGSPVFFDIYGSVTEPEICQE
jgi:hypothetical protein